MDKELDIELLEQDESKLYSFLVNLAKSDQGRSNIPLFEKYLTHSSPNIRAAAIFSLLFALKIDNPRYRQEAIKYVEDKSGDFDLRQWSVSGLAQTYSDRNDIELMRLFYGLLNDENEDNYIKPALLRGLMILYGLSSRDIFLRTGTIDKVDEQVVSKFIVELEEIKEKIQSN